MNINFFFDFLSPFSYLASVKLAKLSDDTIHNICYHAIDLARAKKAIGNIGPTNRDMPVKLSYLKKDIDRWAELYDIPLKFIPNFNSEKLNIGMFYTADKDIQAEYVNLAFFLTWGKGNAPDSPLVFDEICKTLNWEIKEFTHFIESDIGIKAYQKSTENAIKKHVFGVPTMMIDENMWWGNDRIMFLEKFLNTNNKQINRRESK